MLKQFVKQRLAAAARDLDYDMSYAQFLVDADLGAFWRFSKVFGLSNYRGDLPPAVSFAAKLVGTMLEDCGPCTQLMITMAEREGVPADTLRAIVSSDDAALDEEVLLAVRFARASLARDPQADVYREQVLARWGKRGLVSLGFGLTAARIYPTLKYALGFGRACSRVRVAGTQVVVKHLPLSRGAAA
jgi:hypothetical protein